jgi:MraZ protein
MALFLSTYENKLDNKGRVSIPATFRAALPLSLFNGVVLFRSHKCAALEGCGMDRMEKLSASVDALDLFSDAHDDLSATIFADAHPLNLDKDGRITLPQHLLDHAGIKDRVLFVGAGPVFRLWEPVGFKIYQEEARAKAKSQGLTLKLSKQSGEGA